MTIQEFAKTYCSDVIQRANEDAVTDKDGFPFDEIVREDDGTRVKVINTENYQIPIMDIIGLDRTDFVKNYPYSECWEAYDKYVKVTGLIWGEDAFQVIRKAMIDAHKKAHFDSSLYD